MKQEILDLQNRAIKELINKTQTLDEITFRAPTGSGKTFMMAKFMDEVLKVNGNIIFLVSTLSKGGLAKQNYDKFKEYLDKEFVNTISPYLINTVISSEEKLFIPTENNVYILPRDLYKSNSKLMQGPMEAFLQELTQTNNKKIYLIRDESHQATNNLDSLSDTYFTKIFNFSATPKLQKRQEIDVKITDEEAEQIGLIKKVEKGKDTDTFEDAVKLFLQKKEEYNRLLNVHPCLIVQISNKDKADEELNTIIKPILNKYQELKWMVIVDKLKDCDTNDVYKVVLILCYSGMRRAELEGMLTENVDLKNKVMIGGVKTDAGRNRTIPIADCILPLVRHFYTISRFAKYPYLIMPDKTRHLPRVYDKLSIGMMFWQNFQEPKHTAHDTRHTFVSLCSNYNVPEAIAKKIVGHAGGNVTEVIYTHKTLQQMQKWINTLPFGTKMYMSPEEKSGSHVVATS